MRSEISEIGREFLTTAFVFFTIKSGYFSHAWFAYQRGNFLAVGQGSIRVPFIEIVQNCVLGYPFKLFNMKLWAIDYNKSRRILLMADND